MACPAMPTTRLPLLGMTSALAVQVISNPVNAYSTTDTCSLAQGAANQCRQRR
jgi:hypothetical protein